MLTRVVPIALQNPTNGFSHYVFWSSETDFGLEFLPHPYNQVDPSKLDEPREDPVPGQEPAFPSGDQGTDSDSSESGVQPQHLTELELSDSEDTGAGVGTEADLLAGWIYFFPHLFILGEPNAAKLPEDIAHFGPIGSVLMDCLLKMLFTPKFGVTSSPESQGGNGRPSRTDSHLLETINSFSFPSSYASDCVRADVLLCILACSSETLFHPPERDQQPQNRAPDLDNDVTSSTGKQSSNTYRSLPNRFLSYLVDTEEGCSHKYASVWIDMTSTN